MQWVQLWKIWNEVSSSELQNEQRDRDTIPNLKNILFKNKVLFNFLYWNTHIVLSIVTKRERINFFPNQCLTAKNVFRNNVEKQVYYILIKLGCYRVLHCQAYLRHKLHFFIQVMVKQKHITQINHHKLLWFHATASVKYELIQALLKILTLPKRKKFLILHMFKKLWNFITWLIILFSFSIFLS